MTKYKAKTLRKVYKSKIYKGGQKSIDYKENFDFFLESMKQLKGENESIHDEAQLLYSQETQDKHKLLDNSVIVKFNEELTAKANVLETTITAFLETATSDYASVFLKSLSKLQNILNEANELVIFSQNIQKDFNNKNIHIHLIQTFIKLFENLKVKINKLQENYISIQKEVETIIKKLKENKVTKEPEPNDFEYVAQLSKEDFEVLGVQYVKGDLIFDKDTPKQFIPKNEFIKTITDLSNNEGYYLTSNNKQRKVKISPVTPTEPLRDVQTKTYYFALLGQKDQILSGVQYVMCDNNGDVLFENDKLIPFFPKYLELKSENSNFIQEAPNKVDTITYIFIKKLEYLYPIIHVVNEAIYNTLINPQYSNLIDIFYRNKYTEIKVDDYVAPFVLPIFLINPGDFYLINNKSKFPIIFNISKTNKPKRVIIYPNEIICFVYSDRSDNLKYGFIMYNTSDEVTSNLVAKVNSTNNYIFMKSTLIKDKKEIVPILDSQNSLIKVPNFDLSGSLYYSYDDYFNKDPIKVNIIDPVEINNVSFSLKYTPIFTDYVCLIKLDIFVYCDENGIPILNHYGYFQPVLTPIHYSNNQYFYYLEDKKKFVTIKEKYEYTLPLFDENYNILTQNVTPFSIKYKDITIFSDSFGNPIIYNKLTFAQIPNNYPTELLTNIINDDFQVLEYNLEDRKNYISIYNLHNIIEIYRNQTNIIYNHYKDISGNINKLGSYLMDLQMLENQLSTTKNINIFQEIEKTFDNIKDLYNNLNNIEKIKKQQSTTINTINEIKTDKLNILNPIEDKVKQMKEKISSLQNPDDIGYLTNTVNKLDQTINMIKGNILETTIQTGGGNDSINYLEKQDNSIKILGSSLDILEKNLNSSIKAIEQKKMEEKEKVLKEKQDYLLNMDKQILDETRTIQDFQQHDEYYMSRAPTDHEDNFNKYHLIIKTNIKTIQTIIDKVKGTQNFETPKQVTTENVDSIVSERSSNLQLIENIKKSTYELFKEMDKIIEEASKKELNRIKKDVINLINDFELQHKTIEELNNKLKLKHFYEINPNFIEVQQIKEVIENQQNKDILKENYREVYNVFLREKEILNELQMKEATMIVGGSKKKSTRKIRRVNKK